MKSETEQNPVTAVIVAAGMGTRLHDGVRPPKPLLPVAGIPLIGRVMQSAACAGIRKFMVVTGYQAKRLSQDLPGLLPGQCELEIIYNTRFEEPNGVSLLMAAQSLDEPFALLMSDHLFSADRLSGALDHFSRNNRSLLVVEDKDNFDGDMEDATLVAISDGKITAIGKELTHYEAVDTGMFILEPVKITSALLKAGKSPAISDGMRVLIEEGELFPLNINYGYWQDTDTPDDVETAEKKISLWTKT